MPVTSALRVLSVGSLPPEWGGATRGGVATFHRTLLDQLITMRAPASAVRVVMTNRDEASQVAPPLPELRLRPGEREEEWFCKLMAEADVVLLNHIATRFGLYAARAERDTPVIGIIHSWHPLTDRAGEDREAMRRRLEEVLGGIDHIVAPSVFALQEGERHGFVYPGDPRVIPYPLAADFEQPMDLSSKRRGVIFVGELNARKNPGAVIDAVALIPDLPLRLIGTGQLEPELRKRVHDLGIEGRVRFLGSLPSDGVREELRRAEVLCVPSRSESFGIVYSEALACGTPVIGFRGTVVEIARTLGMDIGVGLEEDTPEGLVEAIRTVRKQRWDRAALRRGVLEGLSAPRIAQRYVDVFTALRRS